jgi:PTS system mannose-specific IIC component
MCHILGLSLQAIRVAVPAAIVGILAGTDAVNAALAAIPPVITRGLQVSGGFIVVVGYAMVINMMNSKSLMPFFFIGFLLAAFTNFNLIGFGAIGVICAIFHIKSIANEGKAVVAGNVGIDDIDDSELM